MIRRSILRSLATLIVFLATVNLIATFLHWYDLLWWFDMAMHFLGGMSVFYLSAILWFPARFPRSVAGLPLRKNVSDERFLFEGVITAVLFGLLWEALELYLNIQFGTPRFILLDAISDVFFDLSGALFASYMLFCKLKQTVSTPLR